MNYFVTLGLFSFGGIGGGTPAVQPAAEMPTVEDPEVEEAKKKERELARRRRGRASTILTGPTGLSDTPEKPKATLLGG